MVTERHPADESRASVLLNVLLPAVLALGLLAASLIADWGSHAGGWTQRSGNVLIVAGAYIGYHEARRALQFIGGDLYLNPELWYKVLALALVLIGTVISGYGDLLVAWASS